MQNLVCNITVSPNTADDALPRLVASAYNLACEPSVRILRKSLDARKKNNIVYRLRVVFTVSADIASALLANPRFTGDKAVALYKEELVQPLMRLPAYARRRRVIVVGAGPAGLFASLRLCAGGAEVTLLERGKPVEERAVDVALLEGDGVLNTESNAVFGEGGAGTFSDGKLTARTKRPETAYFFDELLRAGAPSDVAFMTRPHIGTDKLRKIIANIRESLINEGVDIRFNTRMDKLVLRGGVCAGIVTSVGEEISADAVVLACGHSARDTYAMLAGEGVAMAQKAFAVGVRVEHPAELVREMQYGKSPYAAELPPAEYSLTFNNSASGRGVYTFCMCPGGSIINASAEDSRLCVNGMSYAKRDGAFSNAAVVVTVGSNDFGDGVLAGVEFCRSIETSAYAAGGGNFIAPAQRLVDFINNKTSGALPPCSYARGVVSADMRGFLPSFVAEEISRAARAFDRQMRGFVSGEALLVGAETGTSSSVRILRGTNLESISAAMLFPAGEGAGYAGGIVSSAADGIAAANAVLAALAG